MKLRNRIFIIGCGGVGSWLTPSVCLLRGAGWITLVDGDRLEDKNLNRQLFSNSDLGENKAVALARRYGCAALPHFYHAGTEPHEPEDWLLVAVDNNGARLAALQACDNYGCTAIIGANETYSAEAYIYNPGWKGEHLDPRVYYPELLTDDGRDPVGCTGAAQEENPQLVSANFMAAALMQHLLVLWSDQAPHMAAEDLTRLPHKLVANLSKLESHRLIDIRRPQHGEGS